MLNGLTPSNTYAHALAIATAAVGQIVAYVPAWRPEAQPIISGGSIVLAAAMLIFEGITRKGTVVAGAGDIERAAANAVRSELARVFGTPPQAAPPAASTPAPANPAPTPPAA